MPSRASDEDLLAQVLAGDDQAIAALLSRYRTFVKRKAQTYFVPGGDADDVVQEGMIGLYKAVCSFDASKGAQFRTFANLCVTHQIHSAISAARRKGHRPLNWSVPLSGLVADDDEEEEGADLADNRAQDPVDSVISEESRNDLARFMRTALTAVERQVLVRYLDGQSYEAIARALGRSPKAVDNALQRIRRKVESVYLAAER